MPALERGSALLLSRKCLGGAVLQNADAVDRPKRPAEIVDAGLNLHAPPGCNHRQLYRNSRIRPSREGMLQALPCCFNAAMVTRTISPAR